MGILYILKLKKNGPKAILMDIGQGSFVFKLLITMLMQLTNNESSAIKILVIDK